MIGFVTTQAQAQAANDAVAQAQIDRGLPVFWLVGSSPIYSGGHAGKTFIPCDDALLNTPLIGNPPATPQDFPEFAQIITTLGGLDARVEIDAQDLIDPSITEE
jgi:hypothetical protein